MAGSTVATALRDAAVRLAGISDVPRLDAEWLMAHAMGISRSDVLLYHMESPVPGDFACLVARRETAEPLAYIVGRQSFYGLELEITPDVLIPRADTEVLIDAARMELAGTPPRRVLDCGTGSGALLLAALSVWGEAQGIGIERSAAALAVARANADTLGFAGRASILSGDWSFPDWGLGTGFDAIEHGFDLVLSNPPYVANEDQDLADSVRRFEPREALFAGPEGLDAYGALLPRLPEVLAPDGLAVVEIGARQAAEVCAIAESAGLGWCVHSDLSGLPRALVLHAMQHT